jgi:hypothetical protein
MAGMQVLTAISYLQPDNALLRSEWRDQQWQRFCNQRDPLSFKSNTSHGNPNASFATLQDEFAKGGAVEMVINCICNKDPSISAAGLRFGVVLLHLGRGQQSVQLEFRKLLKSPKYEPFFKQLSRILQRGKVFLRERGNPGLSKLGIEIEMMFLVFKMMRVRLPVHCSSSADYKFVCRSVYLACSLLAFLCTDVYNFHFWFSAPFHRTAARATRHA